MVNKLVDRSSKLADTGSVLALRRLNWWKSNGWGTNLLFAENCEESGFHPTSFLDYSVLVLFGWSVILLHCIVLYCIDWAVVSTNPWHAIEAVWFPLRFAFRRSQQGDLQRLTLEEPMRQEPNFVSG